MAKGLPPLPTEPRARFKTQAAALVRKAKKAIGELEKLNSGRNRYGAADVEKIKDWLDEAVDMVIERIQPKDKVVVDDVTADDFDELPERVERETGERPPVDREAAGNKPAAGTPARRIRREAAE